MKNIAMLGLVFSLVAPVAFADDAAPAKATTEEKSEKCEGCGHKNCKHEKGKKCDHNKKGKGKKECKGDCEHHHDKKDEAAKTE